MFNYVWPLGLVVLSNVLYQICAKSVPEGMNPLASLTITYLIGAATSVILYYVLNKDANIITEYSKVNWPPFILGIVIVGLEVGIYLCLQSWMACKYSTNCAGSNTYCDINICRTFALSGKYNLE